MDAKSFVRTHRKLMIALACYAVLIAIALYTLLPVHSSNDRFILGFVICFFAILIFKTIIQAADSNE
jgi:hypothetical protein